MYRIIGWIIVMLVSINSLGLRLSRKLDEFLKFLDSRTNLWHVNTNSAIAFIRLERKRMICGCF